MRLGAYLKSAFINRWNLLALLGATGFAAMSGHADVALPLVLAAEAAYVGLLAAHPKFQKYVDAQQHKTQRAETSQQSAQALRQILRTLPFAALDRFEKLRARCTELRQIATDLKRSHGEHPELAIDDFQIEGLDKLLWIFIRLLFTQYSLQKFLERTNVNAIEKDIEQTEARLAKLSADDQSAMAQKMRRTLDDNLKTSRDRLENYQKALANHQLVGLEIDRLENKIHSLAELAVNRQEPDFIAGQVDAVAGSMLEMERTMNDLQFATGLAVLDEDVPHLIEQGSQKAKN